MYKIINLLNLKSSNNEGRNAFIINAEIAFTILVFLYDIFLVAANRIPLQMSTSNLRCPVTPSLKINTPPILVSAPSFCYVLLILKAN